MLKKAEGECGANYRSATLGNPTVDTRLAASRAALRCAETIRDGALAVTDYEKRIAVEAQMEGYVEDLRSAVEEEENQKEFLGIKWGVGVGYSFGFDDSIDDAEIVDGVVRVTSNKQDQPRVFLEAHRYFLCNDGGRDGTRGCGPFVGIAAKDDDVVGGVAVGWMYGWKAE